ncbi:hypothetical protein HPB48_015077 [Haemaphysalis longicornis]|uniref:Uncharacterized protein n=1 Tax=Haemaphysalis longicornis TaxID=44386 RepID=A0A9J6GR93_HAELO|nr:hypothetical protein HPB48_015077 [Haemaphysalis longicornis]
MPASFPQQCRTVFNQREPSSRRWTWMFPTLLFAIGSEAQAFVVVLRRMNHYSVSNKNARHHIATQKACWNTEDWGRVIFFDEFRFCSRQDQRVHVSVFYCVRIE